MSIPLTILHTQNIRQSVARIKPRHRVDMFEDGIRQLRDLRYCFEARVVGGSLQRWFGSEKYLYNLVKAIGEKCERTIPEGYVDNFSNFTTTDPPKWVRNISVWRRHIVELMYWDDIDRINMQWRAREREGRVPNITSQSIRNPAEAAMMLADGPNYKGYHPESFRRRSLVRLFMRYPGLYRQSLPAFFANNSYRRHFDIDYHRRNMYERKNVQRVATRQALTRILLRNNFSLNSGTVNPSSVVTSSGATRMTVDRVTFSW